MVGTSETGTAVSSKANVCVHLVAQSCLILCDPMGCSLPGSSVHGDSSGKNTGVGCHALLQGIFPTQGSNSGLPHCRQILYHLSPQGSPEGQHDTLNTAITQTPSDIAKHSDFKTSLVPQPSALPAPNPNQPSFRV